MSSIHGRRSLSLGQFGALLPLPAGQYRNLEAVAGLLQLLAQLGNLILRRLLPMKNATGLPWRVGGEWTGTG